MFFSIPGQKGSHMDNIIIRQKLDSLARCIARIKNKRPQTAQALSEDIDDFSCFAQEILNAGY
jgi:hypothetical protein